MKKLLLTLFAVFFAASYSLAQTTVKKAQEAGNAVTLSAKTKKLLSYQDEITVEFLRSHLKVFAADSMKGRETGTPALEKAARYLARQYRKMGLKPVGDNGSYFQHFKLAANVTSSITYITYKKTDEGRKVVSRSVSSRNSPANYVRAFWGSDTLDAPIVFAGFGVVDSTNNVNHLAGVELKNKWVMYFADIPHVVDGDTLISSNVTNRQRLITLIRAKGVSKILVIADQKKFRQTAKAATGQLGEKTQMRLPYLSEGEDSDSNRSYNYISRKMAAKILGLEGAEALDEFKQNLIENITEFEPYVTGYYLKQVPDTKKVIFETQNVVAYFEGGDPQLKDQVVVLTSHYDHVGIGPPDSTGDTIYNGADDDGSGTIGLLNIAYAFSEAAEDGIRPRRSILFLNVAAEEKGLLGSRYYTDHPIFPIEKTVANLNVDMIGRIDKKHEKKGITDYVYIIGGSLISSGLDSLLHVANRRTGELILSYRYNTLDDPHQFYRRSDHWNFARLGVPFIFFFSGVHEDYHQPGDEVKDIRFDKYRQIVQTIYGTTVLVANTDDRPVVDNQAFIKATQQ